MRKRNRSPDDGGYWAVFEQMYLAVTDKISTESAFPEKPGLNALAGGHVAWARLRARGCGLASATSSAVWRGFSSIGSTSAATKTPASDRMRP